MRHDQRCFGRLEQEDQRLKKHYGRWMEIVRSVELESCILTNLTKPSVPVNLVGPQVSLPPRWVPTSRGVCICLCVIRRHLRWVRADSGGNVFFAKYVGPSGGSQQLGGRIIFFARNMDALPCVRRYSWWVPAVRGKRFFLLNTGGPSGGSLLSGGGIIIFRVIRRHFLAAAVDPAVSLSTYNTLPMEVVP